MAQAQLDLYTPEVNTKRILNKMTRNVLTSPYIAVSELIANSWDAGATKVEIEWPCQEIDNFRIHDNGIGMDDDHFMSCWAKVGYDRNNSEGYYIDIYDPETSSNVKRKTFGKNGIGKFSAFCFSDKIHIETSNGHSKNCYTVIKNIATGLFDIQKESSQNIEGEAGTTIKGLIPNDVRCPVNYIREYISQRFIPTKLFEIYINDEKLSFDIILDNYKIKESLKINEKDYIEIYILEKEDKDHKTKLSGITWIVNGRAVGTSSWNIGSRKILDGRTDISRKYSIIILADCLDDSVNEDWTDFDIDSEKYIQSINTVEKYIDNFFINITEGTRKERSKSIKEKISSNTKELGNIPKEKVYNFIDQVIIQCPSLKENDIVNIAKILSTLETTTGKFGIIEKMAQFSQSDWQNLDSILTEWTVSMAKEVLDEIQWRLLVIDKLKKIIDKKDALEVQELQPCIEKSLWIFGPEFESIEYTSNESIASCCKKLLHKDKIEVKTSRNRPDFLIRPDTTSSFYSIPSYDSDYAEDGISKLVIIELKAPNVAIGRDEKNQPQKYYDELLAMDVIQPSTIVTAFVIGSKKQKTLPSHDTDEGTFKVRVMLFDTLIARAESRLFNLRKKINDVPFLNQLLIPSE